MPRSLPFTFLPLVATFATATALEGCSAILGDFSLGTSADANTPGSAEDEGGSSDAGVNAEGPNGTAPDATMTDGRAPADGSALDTLASGDGSNFDGAACAPGSMQCSADG